MRAAKDREPRTTRVQYCGNPNRENLKGPKSNSGLKKKVEVMKETIFYT